MMAFLEIARLEHVLRVLHGSTNRMWTTLLMTFSPSAPMSEIVIEALEYARVTLAMKALPANALCAPGRQTMTTTAVEMDAAYPCENSP